MFIKYTLKDYVDQVSSSTPMPGGGSVNALVGSLGSALTMMTANLSFDKKAYMELDGDKKEKFDNSFNRLKEIKDELKKIVDEDTRAFDGVLDAFKMPKETEEERKLRSESIQKGYKEALEVPYRCSQLCLEALKLQEIFIRYGNKNLIVDTGVGVLLSYAAVEGSLMNVKTNLNSIKEARYKDEIDKDIDKMLMESKSIRDGLTGLIYDELNK